ncbi:MAG: hypothetical protein PHI27_01840 [Eubacteriales bacterium]|nr:hypothetical protein [Eubacteriales bacterium]MDD3880973.1 hypothetical protein [Eubacteriales bacterium]MDD4511958.1 hypothetical protein [Eubacteriales bacterium]
MKRFGLIHLAAIIFVCAALVFVFLYEMSDVNDALFLPLGISCLGIGAFIGFAIQLRECKARKASGGN